MIDPFQLSLAILSVIHIPPFTTTLICSLLLSWDTLHSLRQQSGGSFPHPNITPNRGRYSLEFFPQSLRLVGKSTDYRIPFTSIHRIFLLPKVDDLHVQLVLGLDPPIRQGATRYPFLVAQWPKDEEVDAELNIKE